MKEQSFGDYLVDLITNHELRGQELEYISITRRGFDELCSLGNNPLNKQYNPYGVLGLFMGVTLVGDKYEDYS